MAKVNAHMSMSLDGFIANPDDGIEQLFGWYFSGQVTVPTASLQLPASRPMPPAPTCCATPWPTPLP
jgi:hypothetical protein